MKPCWSYPFIFQHITLAFTLLGGFSLAQTPPSSLAKSGGVSPTGHIWAEITLTDQHWLKGEKETTEVKLPLDSVAFHRWSEVVLRRYAEGGFLTAAVRLSVQGVNQNGDTLTVKLKGDVDPGPYLRLESIDFPGRKLTRRSFLERATRLKRGEELRASRLKRAQIRLQRLPFISQVAPFQLYSVSPGLAQVRFPISERAGLDIRGALSGSSFSSGTGEVALNLLNILGTGRSLDLSWWSGEGGRRRSHLSYQEPFLLGYPVEIQISLDARQERDWGSTNQLRAGARGEIRSYLTGGVFFSRERSFFKDQDHSAQTYWIGSELTLDTADPSYSPQQGYRLTHQYHQGVRRKASPDQRFTLRKEAWLGEGSYPLGKRWGTLVAGTYKNLSGREVHYLDSDLIGGKGSVRGYREGSIPATRWLALTGEIRYYAFSQPSYLGVFVDGGKAFRTIAHYTLPPQPLWGWGVTMGWFEGSRSLTLDIARARGEPLRHIRFHLSLNGLF